MKEYYQAESEKTVKDMQKQPGDFVFAVVTDTHLSNNIPDTLENMAQVNRQTHFSCVAHMGDMINGGLPYLWSKKLIDEQIAGFREAVDGEFYPTQGNHDGFADKRAVDITEDAFFREATAYLDQDRRVTRSPGRPDYFVDFAEQKIRMIFLATFSGKWENDVWQRMAGMEQSQVDWLRDTALDLDAGWTVMLFSHDSPFDDKTGLGIYSSKKQHSPEAIRTLVNRRDERGFHVAGWFVGHFHGDWFGKIDGINFILVGCQSAHVPQLWNMAMDGVFAKREIATLSEDLWDAVKLDKVGRRLYLFRFGAGQDRIIDY